MHSKFKKVIACLSVMMMLMAHINTIWFGMGVVIASELDSQNSKTKNPNVEFDSYFMVGDNKAYEAEKNIEEENKIVTKISVKDNGYLKDANISFANGNFNITNKIESEKIADVDEENNLINLNQIDTDEDIILEIPITLNHEKNINISKMSQINTVVFTGTYVDNKGKENKIQKEIKLELKWTANVEAVIESNITKYVPYDVNGNKGIIIELNVNSYIKDNLLPIKENNIEIIVPMINEILPEKINARASEKNENSKFDGDYNKETGILTIKAKNEANENGDIIWTKESNGGYILTLNYTEEALKTIGKDGVNIKVDAKSEIITYSYDEKVLAKEFTGDGLLKDQLGEIVSFEMNVPNTLSKGYMYLNYVAQEKTETSYTENIVANVSMPELVDKILINTNEDKFVSGKSSYGGNSYYKNITFSRNRLKNILGPEGIVKVNEKTIELKDQYTTDEKGNQVLVEVPDEIKIDLNSENLIIETSKPQLEGKIEILVQKAIKNELPYRETRLRDFEKIDITLNTVVLNGNTQIINKNLKSEITLIEPKTEAELILSTENLSTVVRNENVEFKVVLHTNRLDNRLYSNPIIAIDLPSYIENVDLKDVQLAFDDELKIESSEVVTTDTGRKQIIVRLSGTQTKYNIDSVTVGASIIILTDIEVNNLTPNKTEQAVLACRNGDEQAEGIFNINFVAPLGIVTVNKISNYVDGIEMIALTENEQDLLEVRTTAKNVTAEIVVINNYNNILNNVRILGRTLATDTTTTDNSYDFELDNTFDAPMLGPINTNGFENATIYYSINGSATDDLNNPENKWTTQIADFTKVKSYLIVFNEYTMNIGDGVKFTYDMQIPGDLKYSEKVSSLYTVYFDNVREDQIINDKANSCFITLGTGVAPELEVQLKSELAQNTVVREGQYVNFTATIKNVGSVDAQNVKLNIPNLDSKIYTYEENGNVLFTEDESKTVNPFVQIVAEYTTLNVEKEESNYGSDYTAFSGNRREINVGNLKAGDSVDIQYVVKINEVKLYSDHFISNSQSTAEILVNNRVSVMAKDLTKQVDSNEYPLKFAEAKLEVKLESSKFYSSTIVKGQELEYILTLKQLIESPLENVEVNMQLPNGLEMKEITVNEPNLNYTNSVDNRTNILTIRIPRLDSSNVLKFKIPTKINLDEGIISTMAIATINGGEEHYSEKAYNKVEKLKFSIKQYEPQSLYVKEREEITYTYEIKNESSIYTDSFLFESVIPDGMKFVKIERMLEDGDSYSKNYIEDPKLLQFEINSFYANSTVILKVTLEADLLESGMTEKKVTTSAKISGEYFEETNSNSLTTTIEYNPDVHKVVVGGSNGDSFYKEGRYTISGVAWQDNNADGQRDSNEYLLQGIEVRLLNKQTNEIVKDVDSRNEKITTTSSTGEYRFINLEEGEYLVLFNYNAAKYNLTAYKKSGVSNSVNSDAVNIDMEIDGTTKTVALSDTIRITNSNVRNIDIGLIDMQRSDLRIDKYVSKISVSYGKNTKTYNYDNIKLAKVEIPAKELSNATVIIEYKIVVTNEGGIANYVRKIVDYIPKDMKFSSELNKDWFQSTNGDIYNSSLSNIKLESGESKEVTLNLTKKMTETDTGIVNNNAELYEVYNEEGINDADSTPANKKSGEDDMSAADVVISVKTGDVVIYTLIISTIICIAIGISTFIIKKKIIDKI